jgi:DNA-binding NarL/FixJ family response regulator
MGQNILIAESCELLRIGLRTIFAEDQRVSNIHEAATSNGLELHLRNHEVDLVVVNQSLITDVTRLPRGNFVILTSKLDMNILKAAYKHKGRGYLSEQVSAELLRTVLDKHENAFLVEPGLMPWVMDGLLGNAFATLNEDLLTPREKEIITLLRDGLDRPTIAKTLCIAETTLKTHIKNIARKRDIEHQ